MLESLYEVLRFSFDPALAARAVPTVIALFLLGFIIGLGVANMLFRAYDRFNHRWNHMHSGDKVTTFLGVFVGVLISVPFVVLFATQGVYVAALATIGLMVGISALAVYALKSMADVLPWHNSDARGRKSGIKILDTSVIIDGRVYDVIRTGFLEGPLYVPSFVLEELQHIADSADPLKRQRGRRGLDVLRHLQADYELEVGGRDKGVRDLREEVDSLLVALALRLGGDLVTNDFNLNRVASLQNVKVLNLNDLALALKPNVLPKESLKLTIIREGNQPGQGVGYLDDGTMVVVEQGRRYINDTMNVRVTQVIQTERGKMIFAEVPDPEDEDDLIVDPPRRRAPTRKAAR